MFHYRPGVGAPIVLCPYQLEAAMGAEQYQ